MSYSMQMIKSVNDSCIFMTTKITENVLAVVV